MGKRTRTVLLGALAALALASSAQGAQRFAAPGASGGEPCNPNPCDILTALNNPPAGSEVILQPGDYGSASSRIGSNITTFNQIDVHGVDGQPRPRVFTSAAFAFAIVGAGS